MVIFHRETSGKIHDLLADERGGSRGFFFIPMSHHPFLAACIPSRLWRPKMMGPEVCWSVSPCDRGDCWSFSVRSCYFTCDQKKCYPLVIQHSYWKWPFIVDFPINSMVIFHSKLLNYQRVDRMTSKSTRHPFKGTFGCLVIPLQVLTDPDLHWCCWWLSGYTATRIKL
jgi:hypothetical protein